MSTLLGVTEVAAFERQSGNTAVHRNALGLTHPKRDGILQTLCVNVYLFTTPHFNKCS